MPEVPEFVEENLPIEIKELFANARTGQITVPVFLDFLEAHQITGVQKLLYASTAFQLPFAEIKEIELQRGRGLSDSEVQELAMVVDQLENEGRLKVPEY